MKQYTQYIYKDDAWRELGSSAGGEGTVTSVTLQATSPIAVDDDTAITSSGVRTLSHVDSGVTAGTYKSVTVDAKGHVTAGSNPTTLSGYGITDAKINNGVVTLGSNTITPLTTHQNTFSKVKVGSTNVEADAAGDTLELVAGSNVTLTPDATNDKVTIAATDTTYTDGTAGYVLKAKQDKDGNQIDTTYYKASNPSGYTSNTGTVTKVTAGAGLNTTSNDTSTDGGDITSTGTLHLTKSGVTAGTYQGLTVDKYGRVTGASNMGYTTNTGTITGITMNGASKGTSGVVDLGTVITSHQSIKTINSNTITGTGNVSVGTITKVQANGTDVASSGTANIPAASTSAYGVTELSSATDSTSEALAATPKAVKAAYDLAASKGTGTITGVSVNGTSVATSGVANITSMPASILTGAIPSDVTATTQTAGDNSTKVATTAFVSTAISALPAALNNIKDGSQTGSIRTSSSTAESSSYTIGQKAFAEGSNTKASGTASHAEGASTTASGSSAHAEGCLTTADSDYSHAEGNNTTASASYAHAEGHSTTASGDSAHAEGTSTVASGSYSHAGGNYTIAGYESQTVIGKYNDNKSTTLFEVGKGTAQVRSNAFEVHSDGRATVGAAPSANMDVATKKYVDDSIADLPDAMVFKGSLGTGGTITTLPTASSSNAGYTYKVITAGTYASQSAKVGDTFISDGSAWVLIPSGDEPSGTVTSVKIEATGPIAVNDSSAITTSGTRTISHANSGVTAGTYTSVTVNATGHVTAGANPTTLSGYGITDAKIASGVITLGSNTITPLTASSTLDATKLSGTVPSGSYTNTKNTAGSTDSSSKLFIVGATEQSANPQTYSQDTAYVGTDGHLYSNSKQVVNLSDSQALTNKTYNGYTLAAASAKGVDSSISAASSSTNLPTSQAVASFVEGKGYTTNTGTITSVKMNGSTVSSSGEADLGTVLTSHQSIKTINNNSLVGSGNLSLPVITELTSPVYLLSLSDGYYSLPAGCAIYDQSGGTSVGTIGLNALLRVDNQTDGVSFWYIEDGQSFLSDHDYGFSNTRQMNIKYGMIVDIGPVGSPEYDVNVYERNLYTVLSESDIVDNLTTNVNSKPLSAKQGKALKDLIDAISIPVTDVQSNGVSVVSNGVANITNNVTGSGTSGYIAKFNGANTITSGPQLGSSTTTYLRNNGTWADPRNVYVGSTAPSGDNYNVWVDSSGTNTVNGDLYVTGDLYINGLKVLWYSDD